MGFGQSRTLFNGRDLTGWKVVGGNAKFYVQQGEIVGESVANSPNTFLVTDEKFGDFAFTGEFKVEDGINSGIQFRSQLRITGEVYGYQMEIDHSDRAWTGGVQEEGHRSWLYPLSYNEPAKKAYKKGTWNTFRIECHQTHIRTFVNGILAADFYDPLNLSGFIGLQVHSLYKPEDEGKKVRWRNLQIESFPFKPGSSNPIFTIDYRPNQLSNDEKVAGWQLLWDGKTTSGWRSIYGNTFPTTGWEIKDQSLQTISSDGSETGNDIVTEAKLGPYFDLRFDFFYTEGANSGVKYFVDETYQVSGKSGIGLEFQILDDARHPDAQLGSIGNRTLGSLYDLIPSKKFFWAQARPNQWNQGRIVCLPDGTVEHYVNNLMVLKYPRGGAIFDALVARSKYAPFQGFGLATQGPILLQHHGDEVHFRSLKWKELKP